MCGILNLDNRKIATLLSTVAIKDSQTNQKGSLDLQAEILAYGFTPVWITMDLQNPNACFGPFRRSCVVISITSHVFSIIFRFSKFLDRLVSCSGTHSKFAGLTCGWKKVLFRNCLFRVMSISVSIKMFC